MNSTLTVPRFPLKWPLLGIAVFGFSGGSFLLQSEQLPGLVFLVLAALCLLPKVSYWKLEGRGGEMVLQRRSVLSAVQSGESHLLKDVSAVHVTREHYYSGNNSTTYGTTYLPSTIKVMFLTGQSVELPCGPGSARRVAAFLGVPYRERKVDLTAKMAEEAADAKERLKEAGGFLFQVGRAAVTKDPGLLEEAAAASFLRATTPAEIESEVEGSPDPARVYERLANFWLQGRPSPARARMALENAQEIYQAQGKPGEISQVAVVLKSIEDYVAQQDLTGPGAQGYLAKCRQLISARVGEIAPPEGPVLT